jgi:hypothetical protein
LIESEAVSRRASLIRDLAFAPARPPAPAKLASHCSQQTGPASDATLARLGEPFIDNAAGALI